MNSIIKERIIKYKGKSITVLFSIDRCTHVSECIRGLPAVFDTNRSPWVEPEAAEPDKIAEVIMRCPTGALHFKRIDNGKEEPLPQKNIITVSANGPLYIRGNIEIISNKNNVLLKDTRIALCRCGASKNKPFCDESHKQIRFEDAGLVIPGRIEPEKSVDTANILKISLIPNGPLILKGPVEIKGADDQIFFLGNMVTLCRCGESKKKPFCDGSHKKVNFSSNFKK